MSIRLEMLQVARLAPKVLGDSAELVHRFLVSQQNDDGGFKDRAGRSDLYYSVFGLEGLLALQSELPLNRIEEYLSSFADGSGLDFVHRCCLARCWAAVASKTTPRISSAERSRLLAGIEAFRANDGGYHPVAGNGSGTVYAGFLALGAYQDLRDAMPNPLELVRSLKLCETPDGAWANKQGLKEGSTNSTAAAVTLLRQLGLPVNAGVGDWLLARVDAQGGFRAAIGAPLPDLLSTATSLHALAGMECDFQPIKESCLDFVDSLWTNEGGFYGHWGEEALDCEYTYYGLLALGHLGF